MVLYIILLLYIHKKANKFQSAQRAAGRIEPNLKDDIEGKSDCLV
jgi:hypothetical protein